MSGETATVDGAIAGSWADPAEAYEHALVVLAMGCDCWILERDERFVLMVEPADAGRVGEELSLYAEEQLERRERVELAALSGGDWLALLWAAALVAVFAWQSTVPTITGRFSNWNEAVFGRGEWWRPFTALFLHGDAGHLLGNLAIGGIFCVMAAHSLGAWRGWLLVLASGTAGNALTGWLRLPDSHRSIGASTATFGALGILVGVATVLAWRSRSYRELRPLLVPVAAGLIVLGWWGTGGERTDVLGHLAGWAFGVAFGAVAAAVDCPPPAAPRA